MRGRLFICGERLAFFPIFGGGNAVLLFEALGKVKGIRKPV